MRRDSAQPGEGLPVKELQCSVFVILLKDLKESKACRKSEYRESLHKVIAGTMKKPRIQKVPKQELRLLTAKFCGGATGVCLVKGAMYLHAIRLGLI